MPDTLPTNGSVNSPTFTPLVTSTCLRWIASYSGDANNAAVSGACNDANESTTVAPNIPKLTVTKIVINDNGGTKAVADFPLFVDGVQVTSDVQNISTVGQNIRSARRGASITRE